jgi:cytochrome c oxidase cbb3-type subunit 4
MSGLTYESVARWVQHGGTIYFCLMFAAAMAYALWPKHKEAFKRLAHLPLAEDESDHV